MSEEKLSPSEQLVNLTSNLQEQLLTAIDLAKGQKYGELDAVISAVAKLNARAKELKEQVQQEPITKGDVQMLRGIQPHRKSVQNMLDTEVAQTTKFEKLLGKEMGAKSAYEMRNSDNAWREDESKTVPIIEIQKRDIPLELSTIRKTKDILLGTFTNRDTGMEILFGQKAISEVVAKAIPDNKRGVPVEARMAALYQMKDLIENALCFDSQISEYDPITSKNKSPHSLFIHRMYEVVKYNNNLFLVSLAVEEMYTKMNDNEMEGTHNRVYSLKDIKIAPMELPSLKARADPQNVSKDTPLDATISIPQLYDFVKTYDKNFFESLGAVGRAARLEEIEMHKAYDRAVAEYNQQKTNDGNITNTYSGKENKTMENWDYWKQDNRTLQQFLDDYELQKREVEEKALEEITTESDYEQLPADDKQLVENYNSNKGFLTEIRMALDFVKTAAAVQLGENNELQFVTLMNDKKEYARAVAALTGGFDERLEGLLETIREKPGNNRYASFSNAPLMDKVVSGLIKIETDRDPLCTMTVAALAGVIADTKKQRNELRISDENIINDTVSAIAHDKDKLHTFSFENDVQKESPEIVESNDGYVMNTARKTPENEKEISEKVKGNEVVHNEAPRATTTDPSRVGGNVKLEETKNRGTEDKEI